MTHRVPLMSVTVGLSADGPSDDTLQSGSGGDSRARGPGLPCLTIACHPDPQRVGARMLMPGLLAGKSQRVSRRDGLFSQGEKAPASLNDLYVSRKPWTLRPAFERGALLLDPGSAGLRVDGAELCGTPLALTPERLAAGVGLGLGSRTVLWLHLRQEELDAPCPDILGDSDGVRALRRLVHAAAQHVEPVLVCGETGTGKELVARALHQGGPRKNGPLVAANMATMSESMAISTLFGHLRGAFTGADRTHRGLFEQADQGVLFLDEIGDTPASVQPMLLRVLENHEVTPLGSERVKRVSVRLVAATDQDLDQAVSLGGFRAPLLHRLAGQTLHVPPLRARRDDLGPLFVHFMAELLSEEGRSELLCDTGPNEPPCLSAMDIEALLLSPMPGNVRELRNAARQRARALLSGTHGQPATRPSPAGAATLRPLPATSAPSPESQAAVIEAPGVSPRGSSAPSSASMLQALREHDHVPERAAKALGIASSSMHFFMRNSDQVRRATDIPDAELVRELEESGGDLGLAALQLCVSRRALGMTLRQRGLHP